MKKISMAFAAFMLLIGSVDAQDKAFKKGDMTVELGAGFGVYATHSHQEYDFDNAYWNGTMIVHNMERITHDDNDGAVSAIYPLTFEYGVTNWLGIGARLAYAKYYGKDSNATVTPTVHSVDADVMVDFHLVKSKHFDMPIRVTMGYSNFKYMANYPFESVAKGGGLNYGIALIPRIYFGNHIGMYFNVGYAGYNYPNLKFSDSADSNVNDNNNMTYQLKGSGLNMGIGIIGKF